MRIALLLTLFVAPSLFAQSWTNIGPATESPEAIQYDPSDADHLVASSIGALFHSTDGGESWGLLYSFNADFSTWSIEFGDSTSGAYYVGGMVVYDPNSSVNGVYRTTDGGASFEHLLTAPSKGLRVHPLDNDVMVSHYEDFEGTVMRTTDGGATWTNIGSGNLQTVRTIALDPFDTETIYASSFSGLRKSTDGGATWNSTGFDGTSMHLMETHPTIPNKVYAGTGFFVNPEGFYESEDGGATWNEVDLPYRDFVGDHPRILRFAVSDPDVMYLGEVNEIFHSGNGGASWTSATFRESSFFYTLGLTINPVDPAIAKATSDTRAVGTSNGGQLWEDFSLPLNYVSSLEVLLEGEVEHIYAGTYYGNLRYDSHTGEWVDYTSPGFIGIESHALGIDPEMPELLLTGVGNALGQSIIERSTDYGATSRNVWDNFSTGGGIPAAMKSDPLNSGVFYFATVSSVAPDQILKSTDFGDSWAPLDGGQFTYTDIAVDPVNSGTVYASGDVQVMKSTDGGTTFLPANSGLPSAYGVYCVDISPFNPDVLVCSNDLGIYRTDDGGANWTQVVSGVSCKNVEFSRVDAGIAAVVTWGDEVMISEDDGSTWDDFQGDLPPITLDDLRFSSDGSALYVSTIGQSIYSTPVETSGGGIPCEVVSDFKSACIGANTLVARILVSGSVQYVGETVVINVDGTDYETTLETNGSGNSKAKFKLRNQGGGEHTVSLVTPAGCFDPMVVACDSSLRREMEAWIVEEFGMDPSVSVFSSSEIPAQTVLMDNYPNPFNPSTTISYGLSHDGPVSLKIYSMLGEEVATLVDEYQTAGFRSVIWEGRNGSGAQAASGIYLYRLTTGSVVQTGKMMLMK
ncbi:MAG: T9SS type A sorting domain-containing protein [Ignavibacteria bacterium]|nr:T9SS type A sorting domain-containing protein [Ignavibacteria bacterium]